jgi:sporulenol synthase
MEETELISGLSKRLLEKQEESGSWKLYQDEDGGNLSATVDAYFALLYSGTVQADDPQLLRARSFIVSRGGLAKAGILTKIMLAMNGQYPWYNSFLFPLEALLLPAGFSFSFFELSGYARVHITPVLVAAHFRYAVRTKQTPDISDLLLQQRKMFPVHNPPVKSRSLKEFIAAGLQKLPFLPHQLQSKALERAERFMLERIEADGTLYSYFSSTFLMIYALLALGYDKRHPVVVKAVEGLKRLVCETEDGTQHMQNFTSTVWDTALISHALQEAGLPPTDPVIVKAGNYLLNRQHVRYGDWRHHSPGTEPGGWGFSDINTINPDIDDTAAALRAIRGFAGKQHFPLPAWNRGLNWLLSMQNDDGGWAAFEKNAGLKILTWLPVENAKDALVDPSAADLTGRTLEFLGNQAGLKKGISLIERAIDWLFENQERDGSWYGRWGISYIYGTWAAITGLMAVGVPKDHPAVRKAVRWLLSIQNADGGFGESCRSDIERRYVALGQSTPSQTAWALDALLSCCDAAAPAIERAVRRLIGFSEREDALASYPTGAGLPGAFYIHYHSYRWIWPLLALAKYRGLTKGT